MTNHNHSQSRANERRQPNTHDLTGLRFGRLFVITKSIANYRDGCRWLCRCDCGQLRTVRANSLLGGNTQSCGCLQKDLLSQRSKKHGGWRTPEYQAWANLIQRCTNLNDRRFPDYGGRGITVCTRWRESFSAFLADMGKRPSPNHSIDRINNAGNYEPSNCRWATFEQQNKNRRKPSRKDGMK